MKNNWNKFLITIFFLLAIAIVFLASEYKASTSETFEQELYKKISTSLSNKLKTLIEEKKNATLTIALSLAQNSNFKTLLTQEKDSPQLLSDFSSKLRTETDFKNVWMQLVNDEGVVISRSWSEKKGDTISSLLPTKATKKIRTAVNVNKYDLSFKSSIPLFDNQGKYLGVLEVITHFNSIAKKISAEGFEPIILVDKRYKNRLKHPFTDTFISDYYIANKNIDNELLDYIKTKDIKELLNYESTYSIDPLGKYLIVYDTLFDDNQKPMAYVLMYKKLKYLDMNYIKSQNFIINVFVIFSIIFLAILFVFLADKKNNSIESEQYMKKYFFIFLAIFGLSSLIYYFMLNIYQKSERENYLQLYNNAIERDYEIIHKKFLTVAETTFETTLNNQAVLEIMQDAYTQEKDDARDKLWLLLKEKYEFLKGYDLRQLHFHLKNNESFLRFHRPKKYADDLTDIRATVKWVNNNHSHIYGFEEGRIYNGFRFVFPLASKNIPDEKKHLGSVEISFSAHAIANEFAQSHDAKVGFIISKDVVDAKVFDEETSNYEQSEFQGFYYEKSIKKQFEYVFEHFDVDKINKEDISGIGLDILKGEVFSVLSKDNNTLITFFPLKNPVSHKTVASLIIEKDSKILKKQEEFFVLLLVIGLILFLLTTIYIFREFSLKRKFFNLSIKTQHILDSQGSIVIITNGKEILDANKKFLDFFGYKSLEAFKEEQDCICDFFIKNEKYYHLGKVPDDTIWVSNLENIEHKDRVVLIKDKYLKEHSFSIEYSQYKHEYYIVTFSDISGTIDEQFILERKIFIDPLTKAYNRQFFDKQIDNFLINSKVNGKFIGVIFFDIDHFKQINDTHGHNIGDVVLKVLSDRVVKSIREDDYLIRWGGEEFIILSETKSLEEMTRIAEHLRSMIAHTYFEEVKEITCSFGTTLHLENESIDETIKRVDEAMYFSKKNGRNKVTSI